MNTGISALNPQPLPPRDVVVHLSDSVLNDLGSFNKVHQSILGRLGCGECTSGYDFTWKRLKEFVINEQLEVLDIGSFGPRFG